MCSICSTFIILVYCDSVIRELDYLRKQEESKAPSTSALQWIEVCMLEMSSWIHVQSSAETVHVAMTPPVSPSIYSRYMATFHTFQIFESLWVCTWYAFWTRDNDPSNCSHARKHFYPVWFLLFSGVSVILYGCNSRSHWVAPYVVSSLMFRPNFY